MRSAPRHSTDETHASAPLPVVVPLPRRPVAAATQRAMSGLVLFAALWWLHEAHAFVVPLVFAAVLALVLAPPLDRLHRRGLPDAIGAALLLVGLLAALGGAGWLVLRALPPWAGDADAVARLVHPLHGALAALLPARIAETRIDAELTRQVEALRAMLVESAPRVALQTVSTLVLLYFMLAGQRALVARAVAPLAARRRVEVLAILRDASRDSARFVGALALIYAGVGILTGIALAALGLPAAALWGVLAFGLSFVSYLGPAAMVAALLLAGSAHAGASVMALAPAAVFLTLHAIDSNFVSPAFVGRQLALSPVAVLAAVLLFGWLWGLAGALIAVPLLVAARALLRRRHHLRWLHDCITPASIRRR
ncbi:MAG: AI-2E family transporter [Proteobacteria bacterium]|nr:AI-2E family transporter [Pseudomonadota bacterium]